MTTLTPEDAELVANAVLERSDVLVDAIVKRLAARERVHARSEKSDSSPLTYAEVARRLGKSSNAVKMMVYRKELKASHPRGGRRAYIEQRELDDYLQSGGTRMNS